MPMSVSQYGQWFGIFGAKFPQLNTRVIQSAALDAVCMFIFADAGFGLWTDEAVQQGSDEYILAAASRDEEAVRVDPNHQPEDTAREAEIQAICREIGTYFTEKYLPSMVREFENIDHLVEQLVEVEGGGFEGDAGAGAGAAGADSEGAIDAKATLQAFLQSLMLLADLASDPDSDASGSKLSQVMFLPSLTTTTVIVQDVEDMLGTNAAKAAGWTTFAVGSAFKLVFGNECPTRSVMKWFWNDEAASTKTLAQLRSPVKRSLKLLCHARKAMVFENSKMEKHEHKEFFSTVASSWKTEDMTV